MDAYLGLEIRLVETLEETKTLHREDTMQRDEIEYKLKEVRRTERLNEFGIMEGSMLTVNVIEARELKPMDLDGTSDPYVVLRCAG